MPKNNEPTTKFKVDISELKKGIQEAKRQISIANSEFKAASAGMDDWAKSSDGLSAKLKQLDTTMGAQKKILSNLESQYAEVVKEQGEGSAAADKLKIAINNQKAAIATTQKQIDKYSKALDDLDNAADDVDDGNKEVAKSSKTAANAIDEVGDAAKNAEKDTGGLAGALGNLAKKGFAAIGAAAAGAVTAFFASAEATRELRTNMAKVETAFTTAGFEAETATKTYKDFYAVLGDEGQATEAVNHLAKLCDTEQDLADWTEIATGVYGTFGDSLPIEGLTEAANETAKVGQVTGPLADALNWAGISEDEFNEKLAACNSEQERAALITKTLKSEYEDAAKAYEETAGDIMDAQRAQAELNDAMAQVGAVAEPVMTSVKLLGAEMLNSLLPGLEEVGAGLTDLVNGVEGAEEKVGEGLSNLLTSVIDKIVGMLPRLADVAIKLITTLVQSIVDMLPMLIDTAGQIISSLITGITKALPQLLDSFADAILNVIDSLVDLIPQLLTAAMEFFMAIVEAIPRVLPKLIQGLVSLIDKFVNMLTSMIPKLLQGAIQLFMALVQAIPVVITELLKALPKIIKSVITFLTSALPQLIDAAIMLFMALVDAIPVVIEALVENLPDIIEAIVNGLIQAIPQVLKGAIKLLMALVTAVPKVAASLLKAIPQIVTAILKGLASLPGSLMKLFTSAFKKPLESIKEMWSTVGKWFKDNVIQPLIDFFENLWSGISDAAENTWETITGVFKKAASWFNDSVVKPIAGFFSGMWDKLKSGASAAWDGIKSVFSGVANFFGNIFSEAWSKVKAVFSTGGKIFDGIKDGIVNAFKAIVNAIIRGINKVVALPFKGINKVLETLKNVSIFGLHPFDWVHTINVPQIPELYRGGVLKKGQMGLLEGKGSEAVVPLENNKKWIRKTARDMRESLDKEGITSRQSTTPQTVNNNYTFNQTNTSPKALSRLDIYRQTKNQLAFAKGV